MAKKARSEAKDPVGGSPGGRVSAEERQSLIAEAAYFRAQQRGFSGGDALDDWLAAREQRNQAIHRFLSLLDGWLGARLAYVDANRAFRFVLLRRKGNARDQIDQHRRVVFLESPLAQWTDRAGPGPSLDLLNDALRRSHGLNEYGLAFHLLPPWGTI